MMFGRLLGWYTMYALSEVLDGILAGATFTLRPSLALSYFAIALLNGTLVVGVSQTLRR